MTATVLVTGSAASAAPVAAALRAAGATVLVAAGPADLASTLAGLRPASVDCYVQLPLTLEPVGTTVVGRVRHFLEAGLLTRFRLMETALPMLADGGRVVLVSGHTPTSSDVPDDRAARLAFLDVLAHAVRADQAPAKTRVRVVGHDRSAAAVVRVALAPDADGATDRSPRPPHPGANASDLDYHQWRTEILGLAQVHI